MNLIHVENVIVPENRIRREFPEEAMEELADSIKRLGLIQPIVLCNDGKTLMAGERRLRSVKDLINQWKHLAHDHPRDDWSPVCTSFLEKESIPYVTHAELSPLEQFEAELEENTRRLDLTWQEQARADAALHRLRVEQHGEYRPGTKSEPGTERESEGWTMKKTAAEIVGRVPTSHEEKKISDAVLLADYLDDPLVAAAPNEKVALKILQNLKKERDRANLARTWSPENSRHSLHHGDAYEWLQALPEKTWDCAILDPPYGRNIHKNVFEQKHGYDDSPEAFETFCQKAPQLLRQSAKPQSHLYVFCDQRNFNTLFSVFEIAGFVCWPWPFIWDKGNVGTFGNADQGPRHCYDTILYANRGKRPCIAMYRDVICINQEQKLTHPAGKPAALIYDLLKRTVNPGDTVIDPMVGGGTFFEACHQAKVIGMGNEGDEKYYHMAIEVLRGVKS